MRKSRFKQDDYATREIFECAHSNCTVSAVVSRKLTTGWANLCKIHNLLHAQQEADENCRMQKLETYEEKRDWILKTLPSARPKPGEHWSKVLETVGLIPQAYEMAENYFKRHIGDAAPAVNPTAFTIPLEDEETEAAFRAYLTESAIPESNQPQE